MNRKTFSWFSFSLLAVGAIGVSSGSAVAKGTELNLKEVVVALKADKNPDQMIRAC